MPLLVRGPYLVFHDSWLNDLYTRRGEECDKLSYYSDNQPRSEIIPLYRKMVDVWLAKQK